MSCLSRDLFNTSNFAEGIDISFRQLIKNNKELHNYFDELINTSIGDTVNTFITYLLDTDTDVK